MTEPDTFAQYVEDSLTQYADGLITERELADKIIAAANGELPHVQAPTTEYVI